MHQPSEQGRDLSVCPQVPVLSPQQVLVWEVGLWEGLSSWVQPRKGTRVLLQRPESPLPFHPVRTRSSTISAEAKSAMPGPRSCEQSASVAPKPPGLYFVTAASVS